jgi:thioredoxin reductase
MEKVVIVGAGCGGPTAAIHAARASPSPLVLTGAMPGGLPLGMPAQNGHKYFSSAEIESLVRDRDWLDKATKVISRHLHQKHQKQKTKSGQTTPTHGDSTSQWHPQNGSCSPQIRDV